MTDKRKLRARRLSKQTGMSYQAAINVLSKGRGDGAPPVATSAPVARFSVRTFQWPRLASALNEAIDHWVHGSDRERIRSEAAAASLTVRQAPGPREAIQLGELVCPSLAGLSKTIIVEFEDFRVHLVDRPGSADLNANEIIFEDDRSLAERCRAPAATAPVWSKQTT